MKKVSILLLIVTTIFCGSVTAVFAHCEIPCGIYDDKARIGLMLEDVATIEKSMAQIITIEKESHHNANQLIRWVMNKEEHANKLQEIVTQYFMTQRIKPTAEAYEKKLTLLHQMLLAAMKCKQTTDVVNVVKLRTLIGEFGTLYFSEK